MVVELKKRVLERVAVFSFYRAYGEAHARVIFQNFERKP